LPQAKAALTAAARLIMTLGSRRYEAALNLRLGDLLASDGALDEALIATSATKHLLNSEADALLDQELTARRSRLIKALGLADGGVAAVRLATIQRRTGFVAPALPPLGVAEEKGAGIAQERGSPPSSPILNHRQIEFLRDLRSGEFIDVHSYRRRFKVSEITACRDLAALARGKYLERHGRARATRYSRPASPPA
jgi:hypothetical protein